MDEKAAVAVGVLCLLCAAALCGCRGSGAVTAAAPAGPGAGEAPAVAASPVYDIPRMDKVVVDGKADDWGDGGSRVDLLQPVSGDLKPLKDHDARIRLAWNDQGLLVLALIRDDQWIEYPKKEELWRWDSLEIFLSPRRGSADMCQWVISPGMDKDQPNPRSNLYDFRRDPAIRKLSAEPVVARTKDGDLCVIEVLLPWKSLNIEPKIGREVGVQVWVNDADGQPEYTNYHAAWYPEVGAHMFYDRVHRVRLADRPSSPVLVRGRGEYETDLLQTNVALAAQAELVGRTVRLLDRPEAKPGQGGRMLASARLESDGAGRAAVKLGFPMPAVLTSGGLIEMEVDGKSAGTFTLPDPARRRAELLMHASLVAKPCVFGGESLPAIAFEQPLWMQGLIGPYRVKTTYYDKDYNVVTKAATAGRYGAVVEIISQDGRPCRRFVTLFRGPDTMDWRRSDLKVGLTLPRDWGIAPEAAATYSEDIARFIKGQMDDGTWRGPDAAVLLAGLYEKKAGGQPDFYGGPWLLDRQWWVGLKRKLYGWDKRWLRAFACPQPIQGKPAPVLREGTLAEAGMKPDAVKKIDAALIEWASDTDEAFAVCVARHGVIVLHKAFGTRDGKPMTVDTPSWMASSTKMLSGTLVMLAADQGLLDLDDTPGKFLAPLAGLRTSQPLTIRNMYLHTSGMDGHWGDRVNDMEERMASLYPFYRAGVKYEYDGTGMALACKILEAVSGESLPNFYKRHLLDPLGCTHTNVADASAGASSVPLDYARICQMLLNKGAYGEMRFMREDTAKKMLPRPLAEVHGPEAANWSGVGLEPGRPIGIGTVAFAEPGLGAGTFGHHSASSVTIRIDPVHDLVIVMTRNAAGKNYQKYHPKFIQAVVEGMAD